MRYIIIDVTSERLLLYTVIEYGPDLDRFNAPFQNVSFHSNALSTPSPPPSPSSPTYEVEKSVIIILLQKRIILL